MKKFGVAWLFFFVCNYFICNEAMARSVYLNGVDVSSAHNQTLRKVDVFIDDKGNIFVTAPHYQVQEADTFLPLNNAVPKFVPPPVHVGPQELKVPPPMPTAAAGGNPAIGSGEEKAPEPVAPASVPPNP